MAKRKRDALVAKNASDLPNASATRTFPVRTRSQAKAEQQHIRFNSASPPPPADPEPATRELEDDTQDALKAGGDDDDDEAPEAVSTSAAQEQSLAMEAETLRAKQAQNAADKKRRRKRDEVLKEQAEQSKTKKRKKNKNDEMSSAADEVDINQQNYLEELPDLLPNSLLESIPSQRPPTPPPTTTNQLETSPWAGNGKFMVRNGVIKLPDDMAVADVRHGPVNVSVLQKINDLVPPRGTPRTRSVRENWLRGRTVLGRGAAPRMERRRYGKVSFV